MNNNVRPIQNYSNPSDEYNQYERNEWNRRKSIDAMDEWHKEQNERYDYNERENMHEDRERAATRRRLDYLDRRYQESVENAAHEREAMVAIDAIIKKSRTTDYTSYVINTIKHEVSEGNQFVYEMADSNTWHATGFDFLYDLFNGVTKHRNIYPNAVDVTVHWAEVESYFTSHGYSINKTVRENGTGKVSVYTLTFLQEYTSDGHVVLSAMDFIYECD